MILDRLAQSVWERDWSTLLLEILIVVVGIFIGLQVDDWNNSRKGRLEVDLYLERIQSDLKIDAEFFAFISSEASNKRSALKELKRLIQDNKLLKEDPTDILGLIADSASIGWEFPEVQTVTFLDLQSSGKLALIEDNELRRQISFYYQESLHRSHRIDSRLTGYSPALYEVVDAEVGLIGLDSALSRTLSPTVVENIDLQEVVGHFYAAAREERFVRLLNAEQNYTEFMIAQLVIQLQAIKTLQLAIVESG